MTTQNEEIPQWYEKDVTEDDIKPEARQVLENYSKLRPEEVLPHVLKVV